MTNVGGNPVGHVVIVGKDDPPPWTDIGESLEASPFVGQTRYAVIEEGMTSGRTSVMVAFPLRGERWVSFETSLAMLEMVIAAAHGAEQRWTEGR